MAQEREIAAAQLLVSIAEAKGEDVEAWVKDLSLEHADGRPAFAAKREPEPEPEPEPQAERPSEPAPTSAYQLHEEASARTFIARHNAIGTVHSLRGIEFGSERWKSSDLFGYVAMPDSVYVPLYTEPDLFPLSGTGLVPLNLVEGLAEVDDDAPGDTKGS
ncbi:hypothetical protein [Clavibacter michiganensis]|uniref:hypothetical protein n=1 Tax=Clavibacter michiganensis TaxID=28447 RepID=UPI00292CD485|nr:hypothetical protein [Clavibacter michiganensis]